MSRRKRNAVGARRLSLLLAGTALLSLPALICVAEPARAQTQRSFDIPAQPLATALRRFADQSGMQLAYRTADLRGLNSPGYRGAGDNATILARLLAGSGASYQLTSANTATIARPAPGAAAATPAGAIALDTIEVQGQNPNAVVGQPPVPYAGGQVGSGTRVGLLGNRTVFDTPFNVTGYTDKLIRDQQARAIADVVLGDPSVQAATPRGGPQDQFVIRGFRTFQQDILFDGLGGIVDQRRPAIDNVERVEILKGASTLLNGVTVNGNIGGSINFIPKRAADEPLNRVTFGYVSKAELGAYVDVGRRFGANNEWGVRINGTLRDGKGEIDDNKTAWTFGSIGLDYRGERLRVSVDGGYHAQSNDSFQTLRTVLPGFAIPKAPNTRINANPPWSYGETTHLFGATRAEFDVTDWLTLYGAYGVSKNEDLRFVNGFQIINARGDFIGNVTYEPFDILSMGYDIGARATFDTGPLKHKVVVSASGVDRYQDYYTPGTISSFTSNIYNPITPLRPDTSRLLRNGGRSSTTINRSIAVADTISALNDRISLTLGARYQEVGTKAYSTTLGPSFTQGTARYKEDAVTPAVGLVVKPLEKLSLYANYIEALQAGPTAPTTAVNRGEVFAPFVNRQYEFGAKYDFGAFGVSASAFEIIKQSAFTDPATNRFGVNGEQSNKGIELNVFGEPIEGLRLLGGVVFLDGKLEKTANGTLNGKTAPGVPQMQASLYAEYDLPRSFIPNLTATGRILYSASQFYDQANTQKIPDWTRVDLGLRYTMEGWTKKPIVLRATVENVFDRNYYQSAIDGLLTQGSPRTYLVSAQFDF